MCLPYYMIIGQRKSGTSSLHQHLTMHHQIVKTDKEIHWFTKSIYFLWRESKKTPNWRPYLKSFKQLSYELDPCNSSSCLNLVSGDASPSYFWYRGKLEMKLKAFQYGEKAYSIPQFIKDTVPSVKLILMLRNPVDR